tara:strand:- start:138 stop:1490 length:1353 start_codon:yes stop_codon:yes gene_type:complete
MAYGGPAGSSFVDAGTGLGYRTSTAATDGISGANTTGGKLWLPIWSGEVIHAFDEYNKFAGMVDSKTISSGTTMEFPITGTVGLKSAWEAGEELIGGENSAATTFQVKLDKRPMAAHFELDNVDLMQTQWEYRAELARQAGMTLANARDKQLAVYIMRAACESVVTGDPRGLTPKEPFTSTTVYTDFGNDATDNSGAQGDFPTVTSTAAERTNAALQVLQDCEDWMVYLQENDIPTEGVYLAVMPQAFADIRALGVARPNATLTTDPAAWSDARPIFGGVAETGGLGGSIAAKPTIEETLEYMGVTICKTNHGPFGIGAGNDYAATNIGEARYNLCGRGGKGDNTDATLPDDDSADITYSGICRGLLWQRGCVASLGLQGLKVDTVDDIRRNTVFTVASMMQGTGVLRPECACAIIDNTRSLHAGGNNIAATSRVFARQAWGMEAEHIRA